LFGDLGYGWGGSVIAAVAIVVGIPGPWIIMIYGARLRRASRFTANVMMDEEHASDPGSSGYPRKGVSP
jgi:hypothetical protein